MARWHSLLNEWERLTRCLPIQFRLRSPYHWVALWLLGLVVSWSVVACTGKPTAGTGANTTKPDVEITLVGYAVPKAAHDAIIPKFQAKWKAEQGQNVPVNTIFGLCTAWSLANKHFRGRTLLLSIIDLPFAISPVVAGLMIMLLYGRQGWFGNWLLDHDIRIVFGLPAMVLATAFVSMPFVAREVIPVLEEEGTDQEQAAYTLGATPWQTFWRVIEAHIVGVEHPVTVPAIAQRASAECSTNPEGTPQFEWAWQAGEVFLLFPAFFCRMPRP